jgi:hypothetical protein
MPKRISNRPSDENEAAFLMVQRSTAEPEPKPETLKRTPKVSKADISRVMSAMGKKGGKIGGKRSLVTLTSEERRERALLAAKTRWARRKNKD